MQRSTLIHDFVKRGGEMKPPKMIDDKKNRTVAKELCLQITKYSKLSVMTAISLPSIMCSTNTLEN